MTTGERGGAAADLRELLTNGRWSHEPADVDGDGDHVVVTALEGSDAWRRTSYGFVHDSEHALLEPLGPEWMGQIITVRASRTGDAVTIRARAGDGPWQLVRVAHLDPHLAVDVGLFSAAPTRSGLAVTFTAYRRGPADTSLH